MKRVLALGLTLGLTLGDVATITPLPSMPRRAGTGQATAARQDPELRMAVVDSRSSTPTSTPVGPTEHPDATLPNAPLLATGLQPTPRAVALHERATPQRVPAPRREPDKPLLDDDPVPSPDGERPTPSAWTGDGLATLDRQTAPARTATPPRRFDDTTAARALDDALRRQDNQRKLGIDFPGATTIASTLAATVRPHTPSESTGTFVAYVGSDGRVSSIATVAFDVGRQDGWQAAANDAVKALAEHTFSLRHHYRSGVAVTVRLESDLQTPSRWWDKTERKPPPTPMEQREWRWPFGPSGEADPPPANYRPIELPLPPDMDNLGRYAGFLGLTLVFDVSEIAAHVQRIIYVRSVKVRPVAPVIHQPRGS